MSRFYAVLAVVWTILLAGILVELHALNHQSDTNRNAAYQFLKGVGNALNAPDGTETEDERKARIQADMRRMSKDFEYALTAPGPSAPRSRSSRQAAPPAAPDPSKRTDATRDQSPR